MPKTQICDVCGKEIHGKPQLCLIEGAKLKVCPRCARFGTKIQETPERKRKPIRKTSRSSYRRSSSFEEMDLVDDFNKIIKREREKRGWTQDELAKKLKIKGSIISKIEGGRPPTNDIRKKLENIFNINLMTVIDTGEAYKYTKIKSSDGSDLTLGDVVHLKKKKSKES
ncbi:MAG: TIGR00270 family protein [Candidatus Lokiarchaeota archaeon]|nr:TIGR00270 family protein [Candidatus Lokiarchaeota archaeon]